MFNTLVKEEESKTAFLLSQLASEEQEQSTTQSKSSLEAFLAGQLEVLSFLPSYSIYRFIKIKNVY